MEDQQGTAPLRRAAALWWLIVLCWAVMMAGAQAHEENPFGAAGAMLIFGVGLLAALVGAGLHGLADLALRRGAGRSAVIVLSALLGTAVLVAGSFSLYSALILQGPPRIVSTLGAVGLLAASALWTRSILLTLRSDRLL